MVEIKKDYQRSFPNVYQKEVIMPRYTRRDKIGEKKWKEYQRIRKNLKALRYKLRNVESVINWRRRMKRRLIKYKGGKCTKCGYNKDVPGAYDFHHRNPKEKDFRISGSCRSWDTLEKEVDKCDLVCRNCHAEIHNDDPKVDRKTAIKRFEEQIQQHNEEMIALLG